MGKRTLPVRRQRATIPTSLRRSQDLELQCRLQGRKARLTPVIQLKHALRIAAVCLALFPSLSIPLSISSAQTGSADLPARQKFFDRLVAAAIERTSHPVRYVSSWVRIPYPGGDVPADTGVCTDEIIRSYRAVGIDLQKEVYEDMTQNFAAYPHQTRRPDPNIDHRRVPILMAFFARKGEKLRITRQAGDYAPGDLVTWVLHGGILHIGIIVDQKLPDGRYMLVHNIGEGPKMEDILFNWKIIGHYRYLGPASAGSTPQ
jgi:uncharacterized protein YijF (DUF1287 family)